MDIAFLHPRNDRERRYIEAVRQLPMSPSVVPAGKAGEQALALAAESGYPLNWCLICLLDRIGNSVGSMNVHMGNKTETIRTSGLRNDTVNMMFEP